MTAFNSSQLDEEHEDGAENPIRESSSDSISSFIWDSERTRPHICRCCCHIESSGDSEEKETTNSCSRESVVCCHHALNSEKLPERFMSKQEVLCFLNHELEQERIAAESAANEAISMILRLQVEKAALQMEARHYQELFEARAFYDEETISQLKYIISNQEADRLILESEIDECKEALRMFSECVQDKDRQVGPSEGDDHCKTFRITANALSFTQKIVGGVSTSQAVKESIRQLSIEEKLDCINVQSVEGAQQIQLASSELKEEAKTKYVISSSSNLLSAGSRDTGLEAPTMTQGTCLGIVDHQLRSLKFGGDEVASKGNWYDDVIRECWLGILNQLSSLQKHIWALGLPGIGANHALVKYRGCIFNCKDDVCAPTGRGLLCATCLQDAFHIKKCRLLKSLASENWDVREEKLPMVLDSCLDVPCLINVVKGKGLSCACTRYLNELHQQGKTAHTHMDSWSEVMAIIDSCLRDLEERFATYQSTLHTLEVSKKAMAETAKMMIKNRGKLEKVLLRASNLLKEFLSLTGLGCDILDILHRLVTHLTKAAIIVEAELKIKSAAMIHGNTLAGGEEGGFTLSQGDLPQNPCSALSKLAFFWSSSLEWLSNEKCRAETAFSGWDHI